jgi:hypothetical protein
MNSKYVNLVPRIFGTSILYVVLSSINFLELSISTIILDYPLRLFFVALSNTCVFYYFAQASQWKGRDLWVAIFSLLYGVHYLSLAFESLYLGDFLTPNMVKSMIVNGGIISAFFSWAIAHIVSPSRNSGETYQPLEITLRDWIWKLIRAGILYLFLFLFFGIFIYTPIAKTLDLSGFLLEKEMINPNRVMLVFPIEIIRGVLWALVSIPAIRSLNFGLKKTAIILSLLFSVPMSVSLLLPTSMSTGIVIAHIIELFGENFVFGLFVVWIMQSRSRTSRLLLESSPLAQNTKYKK